MGKWIVFFFMFSCAAHGQKFTNCHVAGGTDNGEGYGTSSEVYSCDQGRVEISGKWTLQVEYGTVYHMQLGRIQTSEPATLFHRDFWSWCRFNNRTLQMIDLAPTSPKTVSTGRWYPNPLDYPACQGV